jgi:hypothetical protein
MIILNKDILELVKYKNTFNQDINEMEESDLLKELNVSLDYFNKINILLDNNFDENDNGVDIVHYELYLNYLEDERYEELKNYKLVNSDRL